MSRESFVLIKLPLCFLTFCLFSLALLAPELSERIQDDTEWLQELINDPNESLIVQLPAREINLYRSVQVNRAGVSIQGQGVRTKIIGHVPDFHLFEVKADNVSFKNLSFMGSARSEETRQYAIYTEKAESPGQAGRVSHCYFLPSVSGEKLNNGIRLHGAHSWIVRSNHFGPLLGTSSGRGYGVLMRMSNGTTIEDNVFVGAPGAGRHAIYISAGSSRSIAARNIITGFHSSSIAVSSYDYQEANSDNRILDNEIMNQSRGPDGTAGIEIYGKSEKNLVRGNLVSRIAGPGILIRSPNPGAICSGNILEANQILDSDDFGIALYGAVETTITKNLISDSSKAARGTFAGLVVSAFLGTASEGVQVTSNTFLGQHHRASVTLDSSAPQPTGVVIRNNVLQAGPQGTVEANGVVYQKGDNQVLSPN